MKKVIKTFLTAIFPLLAIAQIHAQTPVLFSFGDNNVRLSEFDYVYKKNNVNDENAYSKESLEEYLNLYINFRLKVKEAESLGMDTVKAIRDELKGYRDQLAKSYMQDKGVSEKLLLEAYDRMKWEVRASHILIKVAGEGLPADTLKAHKLAGEIRKRILKGEDFEKLAREFSSDPSVKDNGGDIGYFTVMQTVYPFETAAYTTEVGKVSDAVRTKFGYHLVKVIDKRPAQGRINVAHILMKIPENATPEQLAEAKKKADDVMQRIKNGEPFDELARKYSDDKLSAGKGGVLPEFSTGKMVFEFEKAAFALQKDGDVSEPVKTEYGYHIIKRISKPGIQSYDEAKVDLKKRVERDSRNTMATHVLVDRIKKEYNFKENPKNKDTFFNIVENELAAPKIEMPNKEGLEKKPLFDLAGKTYSQLDFANFIEAQQSKKRDGLPYKIYSDLYEKFVDKTCLDYQDSQLEGKYPEFKMLMQEYRDGTLLFALTDQKVWSKALQDTTGLKAFHEANKKNYMWDQRLDAGIFTARDAKTAKAARKLVAKGKLNTQAILDKINAKDSTKSLLTSQEGIFEKGQQQLIDQTAWAAGISDNITNPDNSITFVQVKKVIPPTPKSLEEARGFIVSDYQEFLEKDWIKILREKYPVNVDYNVFNTLIKHN